MERITTKSKRKAPLYNLQRRVRARRDEPEEIPSNESQSEEGSEDEDSEEQSEEDLEQDDDEAYDDDEEVDDPSAVVSQISFGALAKAQASLPNARRGNKGRATQGSDEDSESSDQPDPKTQDNNKLHLKPSHRTSKHAPTEQSSKRQVSRKREVVAVHKPVARDPRFSSAVSGRPLDEEKARRAYDFLDKYREDEMAQLRSAIKKTRDESAKEELRRALKSMQGRKQAQEQRDKERRVLEEHRRQEKELVKQGKKPFYLKKSEQKKRLLVDRFAGLKKKQVDRVIERRRKKLAARERRDAPMPAPRREMS
ncbi:DUF947-domain-containing protein [Annulohypoxylon truncatum]|uniref:DUF947-domain-containing protein n=1 Tax=Annulohypoxylon truncatum TaxID=327061 RepID=UPI00200728D1|nr:DUF947-domain-containing protein [Annulohypoxylon truncatum]KAI1215047.1 DUF947-domain-containing protein [Annulohypoxylon truncatum]